MAEPGLIRGYIATLAAERPRPIVDELADGLTETYRFYLRPGVAPDAAAARAVAEFGDARELVAEFGRANPARRTARRLTSMP